MPSQAHPGTQRGSIVISTAIFLGMAIVLLLGAELGYLYSVKREFQKTADLAAMAGAQQTASDATSLGCSAAKTAAESNAAANLGVGILGVADAAIVATPGRWTRVDGFTTASSGCNAVKVVISKTPDLLLPGIAGNTQSEISATATAARATPRAALNIRSTLASIDSTKSPLLNAVFGGMLGGSLNLDAVGWNGLVNTNINLLSYLDQLAIRLGIGAGNYDQVLAAGASVGTLIQAMIDALQSSGSTAQVAIDALNLIKVAANATSAQPILKLGELLGVQTGTAAAGLDVDLQLFQIVQGMIQIANGKNGLAADVPITIPNIAGATAKIRVIEPPQVSAVGNPELINASLGVNDPNKIYVRTAQVRLLLSVDLGGITNALSNVLSAVTAALSPLINFLESVATLNLGTIVTDLVGVVGCGGLLPACPVTKVIYTTALPATIEIGISSGNGSAFVTGHACNTADSKSLNVEANTRVARLNVGKVSNIFSSSLPATAAPVEIVEIGYREAKFDSCLLSLICSSKKWKTPSGTYVTDINSAKKTVISGLGLVVNSDIGGSVSGTALTYVAPAAANLPEIDAAPYDGMGPDPSFKPISATSIVQSLGSTLGGIQIKPYASDTSGILGGLLNGTLSLVSNLMNTLQTVITNALGPLLDPAVNALLDLLGIDLAQAEIGARLSCNRGVELVY